MIILQLLTIALQKFLLFLFWSSQSSQCHIQGFLPVEALIMDVEVLGLGGKRARDIQSSYKKREELFTEQRRKVIQLQWTLFIVSSCYQQHDKVNFFFLNIICRLTWKHLEIGKIPPRKWWWIWFLTLTEFVEKIDELILP